MDPVKAYSFVLGVLLLLAGVGCGKASDAPYYEGAASQSTPPPGIEDEEGAFARYFEPVRTIHLSEEVIVGSVSSIDVDRSGRLLVTDDISDQVLLFDAEGEFLKNLSPEPCHPGFTWRPMQAFFKGDGSIFVSNARPGGYRFSKSGDCVGGMAEEYVVSRLLTSGGDKLFGFYPRGDTYYIKEMDSLGVEVTRFGEGEKFRHLIARFSSNGLAFDGRRVFLSLVTSSFVYTFDRDGKFAGKIGWQPEDYRPVDADMSPSRDPQQIMAAVDAAMDGKSITTRLWLLDEDKLMIGYWNTYLNGKTPSEEHGFYVMDTQGQPLTKGSIRMEWPFFFAKGGLAYRKSQQTLSADGDIGDDDMGNRPIEVYRFVPEQQAAP